VVGISARGGRRVAPPTKPHSFICNNIGLILGNYTFQIGKGYVGNNDGGVILERDPDTVRGPDIAYCEDADGYDELHPKYGEVPPRLVVEVLSPNDLATVVLTKIEDYLRAGVELVWYVNPECQTVTVYRPKMAPEVFTADQEISGENVLPGFTCCIADFFRLPGDKRREREAGSKQD
jgi:Uma2 family endonuclease